MRILRNLIIFIFVFHIASCVILPRERYSFHKIKNRYLVNLKFIDVNVLVRQNIDKAGIPGQWIEYDTCIESSAYRLSWHTSGMLAHEIKIDIYPAENENKTVIDYSHKYREPNKYKLDIYQNQSNTERMVSSSWHYSSHNTAIPINLEDIILHGFSEYSEKLSDLKPEISIYRKKYIDDYFRIGDFVFGEPASCRKAKDICGKAESLKKVLYPESQNLTKQELGKKNIDQSKQLEIEIEYEVLNFKCEKLQIKCEEDKEGPKTAKDRLEKNENQKEDAWADHPGFPQ